METSIGVKEAIFDFQIATLSYFGPGAGKPVLGGGGGDGDFEHQRRRPASTPLLFAYWKV